MKKYSLSVIMPALNEEKNIKQAVENTLAAFMRNYVDGEIIIINDGSTDRTPEIIRELIDKHENIKTINHDTPKGIGTSVWEGFTTSEKDVVVMFPSDNENDPDEALMFFSLMESVDIVIPFIYNIEVRDKQRRLISSIYNFIINMSFGIKINYHNGTTFFRRAILDDIELTSFGFFYQAELLIKLIRKGYLFAEVPNYMCQRCSGESKALSWKSLREVAKGYLYLAYNIHIKAIEGVKDHKKLNPASATYQRNQAFCSKFKTVGGT